MARAQARRAIALALVAGCVDAYGLVTFGVFTSFMSGNTTSMALAAAQQRSAAAVRHLVPIPAFVVGAFLAAFGFRDKQRASFRPLCAIAAGLLAAAALIGYVAPHQEWIGMIVLSVAMGGLSAVVRRVGAQTVNIGFVTGDLIKLGRTIALAARREPMPDSQGPWDTPAWRAGVLARVWLALALGALFAGVAAAHFGVVVLAAPIAVLLVLATRPAA